MTEQLKPLPCPFCGRTDIRAHVYGGGEPDAFMQCHDCSADGPNGLNRAGAIEAWNRRTQPAQVLQGQCGECGKKASEGWALYCVTCMEEAGLPAVTDKPADDAPKHTSLVRTPDCTSQPAQVPLRQALTDPENQPNQYGVEFLMNGPKLAFKIGNQQFTLDYEPTEPGEFEFMRDMLIHAFSTFTPDVKPAQVPSLSDEEIDDIYDEVARREPYSGAVTRRNVARAIEAALIAKMEGKT